MVILNQKEIDMNIKIVYEVKRTFNLLERSDFFVVKSIDEDK